MTARRALERQEPRRVRIVRVFGLACGCGFYTSRRPRGVCPRCGAIARPFTDTPFLQESLGSRAVVLVQQCWPRAVAE